VLPNGHIVILEIDGGFHMEVEHWEDDLARQRRISGPGRTVVRCTAREVREDDGQLGRDLIALGVPRRAPRRAI
jgi:very-short-patch-repair endonuclease